MFEDIVGSSEALPKGASPGRQGGAASDSTVLVSGRNWHWQGMIARRHPQAIQACGTSIHRRELRRHPAFLIASELFVTKKALLRAPRNAAWAL